MARSDEARAASLAAAAGGDAGADARPCRAAVAMPTRPSSRTPTPRRPNGTWPTRPGSSKPSSCAISCPAIGSTTSAGRSCSTAIMKAKASGTPGRGAACSAGRASTRSAQWRAAVDEALQAALPNLPAEALKLVELGIHHEQQHQELFLTDILATFAENPLEPAYGALDPAPCHAVEPLSWIDGREGLVEIGAPTAASRSIASGRATRRCSIPTASPTAASPTANGRSSSPTAAIARRRSGSATAGTGSSASGSSARSTGMTTAATSPSPAAARSTAPRRSPTSAIMKPTPLPAGPARGCRPRRNGKPPSPRPIRDLGHQLDRAGAGPAKAGRRAVRRRLAMDRVGLSSPTPASSPRKARSANIMASS